MTMLTKEQAAIISVYTGFSCGPFSDVHEKFERLLGRPVFTHEMANEETWDLAKEKVKDEFLALCFKEEK